MMVWYNKKILYSTQNWMLVWKTAALPLEHPRCGAYLLERQVVMMMIMVQQENVVPNTKIDVGIEDSGTATTTPLVWCLPTQEASCDGSGRPEYAEPQHHSIKDSTADAVAMGINDTVEDDPIGLQIEAGASADTVEALQLMSMSGPPYDGMAVQHTTV